MSTARGNYGRWTEADIELAKKVLRSEGAIPAAVRKLGYKLRRRVTRAALVKAFCIRGLKPSDYAKGKSE